MNANVKDPSNDSASTTLIAALAGAAVLLAGGAAVSLHVGSALSGTEQDVPANPADVVSQLYTGDLVWPTGASVVAIFFALVLIILLVTTGVFWRRRRGRKTHIDDAARHMGSVRDMKDLSEKAACAHAASIGTDFPDGTVPGIYLGRMVHGGMKLYSTVEMTSVDIWGPRSGKTTSRVVPAILSAFGVVVTTSNKRDVLDITRVFRARSGRVWVFDPQAVANEAPRFYWDPIAWVRSSAATAETAEALATVSLAKTELEFDEDGYGFVDTVPNGGSDAPASADTAGAVFGLDYVEEMGLTETEQQELSLRGGWELKASKLAHQFAISADGDAAKKTDFFDAMGEDLLTGLIVTAAVAERPLPDIYRWAGKPDNREALTILEDDGRFPDIAAGLRAHYNETPKTRSNIFATARKMVNCLKFRTIHPWVMKMSETDTRPSFDADAFAASDADSLYLLSKEDIGSAGPLVTAFTIAVSDALVARAVREGGRLSRPALFALDEAANVVRWDELPSLYSHYGSRGLMLMTILQSWSQGEACWGKEGMRKLFGAANIRIYGGGDVVDDDRFVENMSTAIGDHYEITGSVSQTSSGRTVSRQRTKVRTLPVEHIESWPRRRALVRISGQRPVIVETTPWFEGPHADLVDALNNGSPLPDQRTPRQRAEQWWSARRAADDITDPDETDPDEHPSGEPKLTVDASSTTTPPTSGLRYDPLDPSAPRAGHISATDRTRP
ncbi:type IV secretory system conjugative DNA transfer family protein [Rhodococcoides fascians]|uniref:type IV secretory system conjugative DNA transfer family protein n=1 Tax=Rhodococcoides fascians TaxID=1828 RepID=UPI00068DA80A|nr:TraM recognition domain-containing protein [Rhodococcus fascians]